MALTQEVQSEQMPELQQSDWQVEGDVPSSTQAWKQPMSWAHWLLLRQVIVSWQQELTMH